MPSLEYYNLAEAFFRFKKAAEKCNFYPDEIKRMDQSLREMDPLKDDPELVVKYMRGAKSYEGI